MQLRNGKSTEPLVSYDVYYKIPVDDKDPSKGFYLDGETGGFHTLNEAVEYFVDCCQKRLDDNYDYFNYICLEENITLPQYFNDYEDDNIITKIIIEHDYTKPPFNDPMYKR